MAARNSTRRGPRAAAAPAHVVSRHQLRLSGTSIEYTVRRSARRRRIGLTIDESGLRVGVPLRVSQGRIESVLGEHAPWIVRKLAEWRRRSPAAFAWRYGEALMLMGEPLVLTPAAGGVTGREGTRLCVAANTQDPDVLAAQAVAWLRSTALDWFRRRATHYAAVLAVRMPQIRLSNARTRWGSCHPEGRVLLNWRLIQMPPALIDYVVVHELAHLREPNHSPRFWGCVAGVLPDHEVLRRTLRCEGHRYLIA